MVILIGYVLFFTYLFSEDYKMAAGL